MMTKYKAIVTAKGEVFLRRLSFYLKKGSIKVHLITGDDSPEFHTHPWDFKSFILFGGYKEFVANDKFSLFKDRSMKAVAISRVGIVATYHRRVGSFNEKVHYEKHRVELFKLFGYRIPCVTIGFYSEKLQLCSFCKELGYCKSNKQHENSH